MTKEELVAIYIGNPPVIQRKLYQVELCTSDCPECDPIYRNDCKSSALPEDMQGFSWYKEMHGK